MGAHTERAERGVDAGSCTSLALESTCPLFRCKFQALFGYYLFWSCRVHVRFLPGVLTHLGPREKNLWGLMFLEPSKLKKVQASKSGRSPRRLGLPESAMLASLGRLSSFGMCPFNVVNSKTRSAKSLRWPSSVGIAPSKGPRKARLVNLVSRPTSVGTCP